MAKTTRHVSARSTHAGRTATSERPYRWLSRPRWYLWDGGFLLIGSAEGIVPPHAHHAIQIVIALDGRVAMRGAQGDWRDGCGIIARQDAVHAFDCRGALGAMLFVDPESREGAWLRTVLAKDITIVPDARLGRSQSWAWVPAGCSGAVGVGLLVFAPREAALAVDRTGRRAHDAGLRLRSRRSRVERGGTRPAGWRGRGHGPAHLARPCRRQGTARARGPLVGSAVRPDLRGAVSRARGRHGAVGRATGDGDGEVAGVSCVLSDLSTGLCRVALARAPRCWARHRPRRSGRLPPPARDVQRASHSSAQFYRSLREEFAQLPVALAQADAIRTLGQRPLIVVTAVRDAQPGWLPLQDELMQLSTNSVHRTLQSATHASLIEDAEDARASSQAIRDVVEFVRHGAALARPVTSVRERRLRKPGERDAQVYTTPGERRSKKYLVTVLLNDLVYTGESSGDEFWYFNPTRFVINDPIEVCVREDRLILKRPDGKDYRSTIVRVMRDSKGASGESWPPSTPYWSRTVEQRKA